MRTRRLPCPNDPPERSRSCSLISKAAPRAGNTILTPCGPPWLATMRCCVLSSRPMTATSSKWSATPSTRRLPFLLMLSLPRKQHNERWPQRSGERWDSCACGWHYTREPCRAGMKTTSDPRSIASHASSRPALAARFYSPARRSSWFGTVYHRNELAGPG